MSLIFLMRDHLFSGCFSRVIAEDNVAETLEVHEVFDVVA